MEGQTTAAGFTRAQHNTRRDSHWGRKVTTRWNACRGDVVVGLVVHLDQATHSSRIVKLQETLWADWAVMYLQVAT